MRPQESSLRRATWAPLATLALLTGCPMVADDPASTGEGIDGFVDSLGDKADAGSSEADAGASEDDARASEDASPLPEWLSPERRPPLDRCAEAQAIDPSEGDSLPKIACSFALDTDFYPRTLPTISGVDWSVFPRAINADTPVRGRIVVVSAQEGDDAGGEGTFAAPYATIQRGLQEASAGDWVVIRGGVYREGRLGQFIAIELTPEKAGVTLTAFRGERVTVRPGIEGINYGLDVSASGVTVNGLDFEGFPNAGAVMGLEGQTISDVVISNVTITMPRPRDGFAMVVDNRGRPVVDRVLFHRVRILGASIGLQCNFGPCNSVRLEGVQIVGAGAGEGSGVDAVAFERGDNLALIDVEVTNVAADGIDLKASRVTIFGARVHHVQRNGIKLWQGGDIISSIVSHTGADSAVVLGPGHTRLLHSVVAYHNWRGLNSYSLVLGYDDPQVPSSLEITNSVFFRNAGGLFASPATDVTIQNSVFSDIGNGMIMEASAGGVRQSVSLVQGLGQLDAFGGGNLPPGIDPGFSDPDAALYTLLPGSPLLDAGLPIPQSPDLDIDFKPRALGAAPDVGPHEASP